MSSLILKAATDNFLGVAEEVKQCDQEEIETRQTRKFLARGFLTCSCVPLEFLVALSYKVSQTLYLYHTKLFP